MSNGFQFEPPYKRKSVDIQPSDPCQWKEEDVGNAVMRFFGGTNKLISHVDEDGNMEIVHVYENENGSIRRESIP